LSNSQTFHSQDYFLYPFEILESDDKLQKKCYTSGTYIRIIEHNKSKNALNIPLH